MKAEVNNTMKLIVPSLSRNESFARAAIGSFAAQLDPTIEEMNDIKSAVSEAVTNSIVHGYADKSGSVEIYSEIRRNNEIYIKIRDKGVGIPDVEKAMQPLFTTAPEGERAGLGFAVMESFMDKLKVTSKSGEGTVVIMQKKIKARYVGS
jgi:stage II sporulation protein AB (anti-sigma F factor)